MNDAEKLLRRNDIGEAFFSVRSGHFQTVTICHGFIAFVFQTLFQLAPINRRIFAFCQHAHDIDNGEVPFFFRLIPCGADRLVFVQFYLFIPRHFYIPHAECCLYLLTSSRIICLRVSFRLSFMGAPDYSKHIPVNLSVSGQLFSIVGLFCGYSPCGLSVLPKMRSGETSKYSAYSIFIKRDGSETAANGKGASPGGQQYFITYDPGM